LFQDVTHRSRLGPLVAARSGWSNGLFDFDNDGWKDLFTADSHVNDEIERFESSAYRLPNSIFRNMGDGTFSDASAGSGLDAGPPRVLLRPASDGARHRTRIGLDARPGAALADLRQGGNPTGACGGQFLGDRRAPFSSPR